MVRLDSDLINYKQILSEATILSKEIKGEFIKEYQNKYRIKDGLIIIFEKMDQFVGYIEIGMVIIYVGIHIYLGDWKGIFIVYFQIQIVGINKEQKFGIEDQMIFMCFFIHINMSSWSGP